jgi:GTP cyclohydrolase FolE2
MYVGLPHHFKGTHMSRFVEILNAHEREISPDTFRVMLREMVKKLEAQSGHVEMTFPYFVNKKAPVSGVQSLMDYEVTFVGEIADGVETFTLKVLVPVTSLCPCSKKISERGAHNQRSHVTDRRAHQRLRLDRGADRQGREPGLQRAVGPAQAPGREVRHRARLRQSRSSSRTWCATSPRR